MAIFPTFNRFQVLNNTEFAVAHHVPGSLCARKRNRARKKPCKKKNVQRKPEAVQNG